MQNSFYKKLDRVSRATERLPQRLAVVAVNFSKERFVRKDWVDRKREKWKPRQRKDRGSLMARTGRLKRSIRKLLVNRNRIVIGTDVPYARAHNDGETIKKKVRVREHSRRTRRGGTTTVKEHPRQMNLTLPPRKFIGESAVLMRRIERQVERDFKNALK